MTLPDEQSDVSPAVPVLPRSLRYAAAVTFAVVALYASVIEPGEGPPPTPMGGTALLHVASYAVLAWLLGYATLAESRRALLLTVVVATLFGAAVEVVQGFVPYRTASALDVLLNAVGAVVGALLWRAVAARIDVDTDP